MKHITREISGWNINMKNKDFGFLRDVHRDQTKETERWKWERKNRCGLSPKPTNREFNRHIPETIMWREIKCGTRQPLCKELISLPTLRDVPPDFGKGRRIKRRKTAYTERTITSGPTDNDIQFIVIEMEISERVKKRNKLNAWYDEYSIRRK